MRRYTEWLKEKMMCEICKREISRGHIPNHIKSKIHIKNSEIAAKKNETRIKASNKNPLTITWD
jgi:hypothetical protein